MPQMAFQVIVDRIKQFDNHLRHETSSNGSEKRVAVHIAISYRPFNLEDYILINFNREKGNRRALTITNT
jgi:hypothetical protein